MLFLNYYTLIIEIKADDILCLSIFMYLLYIIDAFFAVDCLEVGYIKIEAFPLFIFNVLIRENI